MTTRTLRGWLADVEGAELSNCRRKRKGSSGGSEDGSAYCATSVLAPLNQPVPDDVFSPRLRYSRAGRLLEMVPLYGDERDAKLGTKAGYLCDDRAINLYGVLVSVEDEESLEDVQGVFWEQRRKERAQALAHRSHMQQLDLSDPMSVVDHLLFMAKQGGEDEANKVHEAARQVSRGLDDTDLSRELLSDYFKKARSWSRSKTVSRAEQRLHAQKMAQQRAAVTAEYVSTIFPVDPVPACGEGEDEARIAAELAALQRREKVAGLQQVLSRMQKRLRLREQTRALPPRVSAASAASAASVPQAAAPTLPLPANTHIHASHALPLQVAAAGTALPVTAPAVVSGHPHPGSNQSLFAAAAQLAVHGYGGGQVPMMSAAAAGAAGGLAGQEKVQRPQPGTAEVQRHLEALQQCGFATLKVGGGSAAKGAAPKQPSSGRGRGRPAAAQPKAPPRVVRMQGQAAAPTLAALHGGSHLAHFPPVVTHGSGHNSLFGSAIGWTEWVRASDGRKYYHHAAKNITTWDMPLEFAAHLASFQMQQSCASKVPAPQGQGRADQGPLASSHAGEGGRSVGRKRGRKRKGEAAAEGEGGEARGLETYGAGARGIPAGMEVSASLFRGDAVGSWSASGMGRVIVEDAKQRASQTAYAACLQVACGVGGKVSSEGTKERSHGAAQNKVQKRAGAALEQQVNCEWTEWTRETDGRKYYYHARSNISQWEPPPGWLSSGGRPRKNQKRSPAAPAGDSDRAQLAAVTGVRIDLSENGKDCGGGWRQWLTDKGLKYFHHAGTNITQWELPAALPPRPDKAPTEERRKAGLNEAIVRAVAQERAAKGDGQRRKLPAATATDAVSGPAGGAKAVRKAAAAEAGGERPAASTSVVAAATVVAAAAASK